MTVDEGLSITGKGRVDDAVVGVFRELSGFLFFEGMLPDIERPRATGDEVE